MIIREDKSCESNELFPNSDWYAEGNHIIDETTEQGKLMAQKYIENYPFVDFKAEGQMVTEVMVLNRPKKPVPSEGQEVLLVQDNQGMWQYDLVDRPLTREQELEQQVADLQGQIDLLFG